MKILRDIQLLKEEAEEYLKPIKKNNIGTHFDSSFYAAFDHGFYEGMIKAYADAINMIKERSKCD